MPGSTPVRRSSLRQQIADALRDEVLTGRLPAGQHFTVKEIAELYGVSATPVREALVDLAAQGLLDVEHHRGFQVRQFTHDDYRGLIEARTLVTEGIFRRLAARGPLVPPEEGMASVRRRAEAASSAARAGALDVLIGCDLRFWRELAVLTANAHVCEFLDRLRVQSWVFAVPLLRGVPDLAGVCWAEHVSLVDAIRDGDTAGAKRIVEAYNEHSLSLMRGLVDRRGQAGTADAWLTGL
ncbi:GntR family transcriptional regulator [Streptantibioticus ferralitis]|uniref:GntR family transcriptional regulator n=1 Tax=Streptantibioticus ferralitis TaxID=236510 RepID=A0ABT5Z7U2_9ACTN|nr:GntR family transcriptional regulator [Streptantibioticus ferralitis]MDF2259902.1 GntR family transcriptional regulator [Streptantibioticus ferralitis]